MSPPPPFSPAHQRYYLQGDGACLRRLWCIAKIHLWDVISVLVDLYGSYLALSVIFLDDYDMH